MQGNITGIQGLNPCNISFLRVYEVEPRKDFVALGAAQTPAGTCPPVFMYTNPSGLAGVIRTSYKRGIIMFFDHTKTRYEKGAPTP